MNERKSMTSHLTLTWSGSSGADLLLWSWSDCSNPTTCEKVAHVPFDADTANSYPREWIETASDGWVVENDDIVTYNAKNELHREDGPAAEEADGTITWWYEGRLHRTDGPARKYVDGATEWWIHGEDQDIAGEEPSFPERLTMTNSYAENAWIKQTFESNLKDVFTLGRDQREQALLVRSYADAFIRCGGGS